MQKRVEKPETLDLKTPQTLLAPRADRDMTLDYSTSASVLPSSIQSINRVRGKHQISNKVMTSEPRKHLKKEFNNTPSRDASLLSAISA